MSGERTSTPATVDDGLRPVTIVVSSIKGGVGKTTTAVNLAQASAQDGRRTLVWDLDPQGASTWSLAVGERVPGGGRRLVSEVDPVEAIASTAVPGIDLLPADFSLRHLDLALEEAGKPRRRMRRMITALAERYDTVVVDCPPGITLVIESVLHAADAVVVPVVPASLAMRTVGQLKGYVAAEKKLRRTPVLPFLSMVDRRRATHRQLIDELTGDAVAGGDELLPTAIPLSVDVERMGLERRPVAVYAPDSRAVDAYRSLWRDVMDHVARSVTDHQDQGIPT